jgi:hypothetical protein
MVAKGLKEAAERAEVFSIENPEDDQVTIRLHPGKLKITGRGASGWFSEFKKIRYKGAPVSFTIAPKLLMELVTRHNECEITKKRLKVNGGKFTYVTVLGMVEEKHKKSKGDVDE